MTEHSTFNALAALALPRTILKPLVLALGLSLLSACGSSDDFPGSSDNQTPDPLVTDIPLFYIERPLREGDNGGVEPDDLKDPLTFHGNARLYMKVRADQSAATVDLSARAVPGNVDVRDLDVSPDGLRVVFSLRAPQIEDADEEDQPTWNLWEYDIANDQVRRLISDSIQAEKGHDITPRYLPDGKIIFASTRQDKSRSILLDEGKASFSHLEEDRQQPALNLHILDPETGDTTQVTFNQSHDLYPVVMNNGKIVFTRWENFGSDALSLYEMNPDGTELQLLYGHHSQGTGAANTRTRFIRSNVLPNGDLFTLIRPDETTFYGGDFVRIDTERYIDNTQAVATSSGSGPAQTSVTDREILTNGQISPGGYYSAFYPLWDDTGRAIVSWSRCRITLDGTTQPCNDSNLSDPDAEEARPAYGIWTYDYVNDTQIPIIAAREGIVYTDVVLAAERTEPAIRAAGDSLTGPVTDGRVSPETFSFMTAAENEEAIIHIRNVYDFDGAYDNLGGALGYAALSNPTQSDAANRPARFLRVIKAVSEPDPNDNNEDTPDPDNASFGVAGAQRMKEIIGYAPIEPDGSVKMRVPANVALMISMVDANGKMLLANGATGGLLRHQNWITLRPGEVMECKGCHTANSTAPHGRYDAQVDSLNAGRPQGATYPGAVNTIVSPFPNATMAEARVAAAGSDDDDLLELSTDLLFSDVWTDPMNETPDDPISIRYADLPQGLTSPANSNCNDPSVPRGWNSRCRVVINYEAHIMQIWELDRGALPTPILATQHDEDNDPMTPALPATCVRCHSPTYMAANADVNGDPPTQLNLFDTPADAVGIQRSSYRELFFTDVPKEVVDGNLVDCTQQVPRLDDNGDPVLDDNGDPIFDTVTCPASVPATLSGNGAYASNRFFSVFEGAGTHVGYLTPAELKLIAEWLDIGAQYYNNHFDAPPAN